MCVGSLVRCSAHSARLVCLVFPDKSFRTTSVANRSIWDIFANLPRRDREWQKWPITIVTGAYMGYVAGKFAFGYLLHGKRISFD